MDKTFARKIHKLEYQVGVRGKVACSAEQNKMYTQMVAEGQALPDNVKPDAENPGEFMQIVGDDLSPEERDYLLSLKTTAGLQMLVEHVETLRKQCAAQYQMLEKIRFWTKFFPVCAIVCVCLGLFFAVMSTLI